MVSAILVAPALLFIFALIGYPIIQVFLTSMTNESLLSIGRGEYVGFENYLSLLTSPRVRKSLVTTLVYAGASVAGGYLIGLAMAFALEQVKRGQAFLRGMFIIPYATTAVVVAFIFRYMLDPQVGIINYVLVSAGIAERPVGWLASTSLALGAVILASIWKSAPFYMLLIGAGLRSIPQEVNEAAAVDGAERWKKFRLITFPLLIPISVVAITLDFIRWLNAFPIIWTMTSGGPVDATNTTVIEVYSSAFRRFELGYSSALGFMWLIVVIVVLLVQVRIATRTEDRYR